MIALWGYGGGNGGEVHEALPNSGQGGDLLGRWLIGQAILTKSYNNGNSIADLLARSCASAANLTLVLYILDFLKVVCRVA